MGQFVLGLHAGHNASACIGDQTGIIYAIQEERLCGEKNYWGFPARAVQACLNHVGASPKDVATIAYGGIQVLCSYHSREDVLRAYRRQREFFGRIRQRYVVPLAVAVLPKYGQKELAEHLRNAGLANVPLIHYDHHYGHAATAYYGLRQNPTKKYLVLTCDGDGDGACATVRIMGDGQDTLVASTPWSNSLGAIYSWVTFGMGFVPLEHEYKLMGMAPYASSEASEKISKVFESYLGLDASGLSFARRTLLGTSALDSAMQRDLLGERFDHICGGLQRFTEKLLCQWTANAVRKTGIRDVVAAGGVFMNVKANKLIAALPEVDSFQAFPSCGDETLSLGAYYLEAAKRYGTENVRGLAHYYLGDSVCPRDAAEELANSGFSYQKPADMAAAVAELLVKGQPVARCAGPMEFGARALGNRSILADPRNLDVVRVINRMVKKRDFWMPFAPMIMAEWHDKYVQNPKHLCNPYMMMTFDSRDNFRDLIAAVHNADLTCRTQILEKPRNPDMYAILEAFAERTGCGVVLNTSFNLHGFPVVRNAADALHVFRNSGLEHLQLGDYLVSKA